MGEPIVLTVNQMVGGSISVVTTPPASPSPYFAYDSNRVITGLVQGSPNEYHSGTYDDWYNGYEDPETGAWVPGEGSYSVWGYTGSNVTDSYALGIGDYAFNDEWVYYGVPYGKNISGSLSFPNVTRIGDQAFYYCQNLTSISLPNVTSIGSDAFYGCTGLTSVTIGSDIEAIGTFAFETGGNSITLTIGKPMSWVETRYGDWGLPSGSTIVCTDGTISIT